MQINTDTHKVNTNYLKILYRACAKCTQGSRFNPNAACTYMYAGIYIFIYSIYKQKGRSWSPLCKEGKSPLQLQLQLCFLFVLAYVHVCWVICKRQSLRSASSQHRHGIALLLLKYWLRARERAQQVKVPAVQVWSSSIPWTHIKV